GKLHAFFELVDKTFDRCVDNGAEAKSCLRPFTKAPRIAIEILLRAFPVIVDGGWAERKGFWNGRMEIAAPFANARKDFGFRWCDREEFCFQRNGTWFGCFAESRQLRCQLQDVATFH